jgi:hypothetical protein
MAKSHLIGGEGPSLGKKTKTNLAHLHQTCHVDQKRITQPRKHKVIVPWRNLCYCCLYFCNEWRAISSLIQCILFPIFCLKSMTGTRL